MNTIRMSCYIRFAVERLGIKDYEVWVKGDDTVLFLKPTDTNRVLESIEEIFVSEQEWNKEPGIIKGLG